MKKNEVFEEMQLHLELLRQWIPENGGNWSEYSESVYQQLMQLILKNE